MLMESGKKVEDKIKDLEERIANIMKKQSSTNSIAQPVKTQKTQEETCREETCI